MTLVHRHIAAQAGSNVQVLARLLHQHPPYTIIGFNGDGFFLPALDQGISDPPKADLVICNSAATAQKC
ncbi:hypothetical protein R1T40_09855 [Tritonibacter scottomollicae]|uniref:Uncharacterized protein n=1 Tax=Tritonibacter scottomollicae TaxID=483013 RepID=A0ABZ0HLS4_TRISK|nr:hypothetical protein [Tritonibacter scottomollicae]WOI35004.1 hypothetical protein R1T40_09855 [Tritonibacter scottomollicae]